MNEDKELEADESMYVIPLKGKEIPNDGKVRLMLDFGSVSDAEKYVAELDLLGSAAIFMEDALTENSVAEERKFILRRVGDMPEEFQLHKVTVTIDAVGGKK